jgi:acyl-CoA reductase-like NAD-dependent aldehyde dehydrogenase
MTTPPPGLHPDVVSFLTRPLHPMLIGGEPDTGGGEQVLASSSPSDGAPLGALPLAGAADVDRAVAAARRAYDWPWGTMAPAERERRLRSFAALVEEDAAALAEIESLDNGKPIGKTRAIDAPVAARLAYTFAGWPTKIAGETPTVSAPDLFVYTVRRPLGVVATIIPWNYPLIHTVQKVMPALACGNTVILKPSEKASLPSLRLGELAARSELPPGVVNVVTGDRSTGALLAAHPEVDKVAFTGSVAAGQAVMRAAADSITRVSLELGNKGANLVFADADLDVAIPRSFGAAFGNTGQSCVAGARLFVEEDVYEETVERLAELAGAATIGHALDPATDLGPIVDEIQLEKILGYIATGGAEGAELRYGGNRLSEGAHADGWYVEPTIFTGVDDAMTIACEEIFGPVLTVHPFSTEEEAIRRANATPYGLAAAVWTGSVSRAHRVASGLETGVVWVNTFDMFDPSVPFGGRKQSGFGRDNGRDVIDMYTESQAVWVSTR